jgi:hypothetical protein
MLFQQVSDPDGFWRTVADRAKEETLSAFGTKTVTLYLALLVSAVAVALRVLSDGITSRYSTRRGLNAKA